MLVQSNSYADAVTIQTAKGEVSIATKPASIATLDVNVIENLHALGVMVAGIPDMKLPDYLSDVVDSNPAKIGTLFEADQAAIEKLNPELMIVALRSSGQYDVVSALTTTIDLSPDNDNYVPSALNNLITIGRIVGKEQQAKKLVDDMQDSLAELKQRFAGSGKSLIILTNNQSILPVVPDSRQGWPYKELGLVPAITDINVKDNGRPVPISYEQIRDSNPDWIFVVDRAAATNGKGVRAQQLLDNALITSTNAAKNGRVVYLNPYVWYVAGNGILSLHDAVSQFKEVLDK